MSRQPREPFASPSERASTSSSRPTFPSRLALRGDGGSATLELVIVAPALLALLGLVIVAARVTAAGSAVEQAASAGARAASLERDARSARAAAADSVRQALTDRSIACKTLTYAVDVDGFAVAVGRPATTSVAVSCTVALADLAVPGMPGSRVVEASATSPLDRFRGRS